MIEPKQSQARDIPLWLTGIVLLACLGGGGLLIRWYMEDRTSQSVDITKEVEASKPPSRSGGGSGNPYRYIFNGGGGGGNTGGGGGGGNPGRDRVNRTPPRDLSLNGVQPFGSSSFRVKSGNTVMIAPASPGGTLTLSYFKPVRTSEQEQLASMFIAVRGESAWREFLEISDEQRKLFDSVPAGLSGAAPMKFDPDNDRKQAAAMWKAYRDVAAKGTSAEKAEAEKVLLAGLDALGQKNLQPTKDFEEARSNAIRAAIKPEQIRKFLNYGSDRPPVRSGGTTATPPAVAPAGTRPPRTFSTTPATTGPATRSSGRFGRATTRPSGGELLAPSPK